MLILAAQSLTFVMMAKPPARYDPNRLFTRELGRHFRPRYSVAEARWTLLVLLILAAIVAWVVWRGARPDPQLFSASGSLPEATLRPVGRGPLPAELVTKDSAWREAKLGEYDEENLFEKINGRADYFLAFGFQRLHTLLLEHKDDQTATIDIELYDLGRVENALGAYQGELPDDAAPELHTDGIGHVHRNALLLVRGQYFIRAIGSAESKAIRAQLNVLQSSLNTKLAGQPLPVAYRVLIETLHIDPKRVGYHAENVFSFAFATRIFVAKPDDDSPSEVFLALRDSPEQANQLAKRLAEGFADLGERVAVTGASSLWSKDHYLGRLSTALAQDRWVMGVRRVASLKRGQAWLASLKRSLEDHDPPASENSDRK